MDWQTILVILIVVAAAIYAGRVFLQQFSPARKSGPEECAHCGPHENAGHKPVQILKNRGTR